VADPRKRVHGDDHEQRVFKNRYVIDGNGTCSQPAVAPATQTQGGSISISPFTFHGFIDPAS